MANYFKHDVIDLQLLLPFLNLSTHIIVQDTRETKVYRLTN